MRYIAAISLLCVGCATVAPSLPKAVEIAYDRRPEERPLPPNPRAEKLPDKFAGEEWVEPAEAGQVVAKPGLLVSEARVARDILFRTRYDELRTLYDEDRKVWVAHRDYYEKRLVQADTVIQDLQPNWWEQHKDAVYLTVISILTGYSLTLLVISP